MPGSDGDEIALVRPLLECRKARLIATLRKARHRLRRRSEQPRSALHPAEAARLRCRRWSAKGLDAERLALLARRVRRADAALEAVVDEAVAALAPRPWPDAGPIAFPAVRFARLPAEVALRLLGRAIAWAGNEGPVELGKLEALARRAWPLLQHAARFRRTLAGAVVTRSGDRLTVERAPARAPHRAPPRNRP